MQSKSISGWLIYTIVLVAGLPGNLDAQSPPAQQVLFHLGQTVPGGPAGIAQFPQVWLQQAIYGVNSARMGGMIPNQAACAAIAREVADYSGMAAGFPPNRPDVAAANTQLAGQIASSACPPNSGQMPAPAAGAAPPPSAPSGPTATAAGHIDWALHNTGPCTRVMTCAQWTKVVQIGPYPVLLTRLNTSARDQIFRAKAALLAGYSDLAFDLVQSTQIHNQGVFNWMADNKSAVLSALFSTNIPELNGADLKSLIRAWYGIPIY